MKLFCIFAFERGTCCIQIEDDWLVKFGCIGHTLAVLFFSIDTRVRKPCHDYSVFSFHVVGRHCLIEILGYITSFCSFWRCTIFCSMIVFRHGVLLQQGPHKEFVFG